MTLHRIFSFLTEPLRIRGHIHRPLVVLYLAINGLMLINALLHDPRIGYDAHDHLAYLETLAAGRLPAQNETREFFNPPLPYLVPAMVEATGRIPLRFVLKGAQLLNVLFALGLTFYLLKICRTMRPEDATLRASALGLLGIMPVFYKTFVQIRGEPLLAMLVAMAVYEFVALYSNASAAPFGAPETNENRDRGFPSVAPGYSPSTPAGSSMSNRKAANDETENSAKRSKAQMQDDRWRTVRLGVFLGLAALSRQWAFFLFPAFFLFALAFGWREKSWRLLKQVVLACCISFAVGGWFYLHLLAKYGTVTAFNREGEVGFSLANQPPEFYFGLSPRKLFSEPVRPHFANQLIPIFYSDFWGDYWWYFLIYGRETTKGYYLEGLQTWEAYSGEDASIEMESNRDAMAPLLGRANLVALFPTLLLLAGAAFGFAMLFAWLAGKKRAPPAPQLALALLVVACSLAGYAWFLLMHPDPGKGDTIKASYMMQVYPFLALLAGETLVRLRARTPRLFIAVVALLALCVLYNLPLLVTRTINLGLYELH